ncbi:unnamed protein product [Gordionus sp. m RMFG-2023]
MISKICICFIIFGTKINLYNTRKNSISCYTCTSPPYPGGGVDFDKDMCKSQICNGLIDKQKCVKIIEKIEGQTRYTRACLDVIYSSSHREEIPADTYRGCRKASDKISRPGDPYAVLLVTSKSSEPRLRASKLTMNKGKVSGNQINIYPFQSDSSNKNVKRGIPLLRNNDHQTTPTQIKLCKLIPKKCYLKKEVNKRYFYLFIY